MSLQASHTALAVPDLDIAIEPVSGRVGAEVHGVRCGGDLSPKTVETLWAALMKYKVLFFRGQGHLDDAEHNAFSRLFGPTSDLPTLPPAEARADAIVPMDGAEPGGRSDNWHTDGTFTANPHKASVLRNLVAPAAGGDTLWCNMVAAYDTLRPEMQALAEKLWCLHSNEMSLASTPKMARDETRLGYRPQRSFVAEHPMVAVHPETGEKMLVLGYFVQRVMGYSRGDSNRLLDLFTSHATQLENCVRWRWKQGDLIMWDNRATMHYAVNDYGTQARHVRRITLAGGPVTNVDGQQGIQRISPDLPTPDMTGVGMMK